MNLQIKPRTFKGTRDFLPTELLNRKNLINKLQYVFELYGFAPLETPAMEFVEVLTGKYGDEGDKLIYKLAYKGGNELALRYDLTVPLSRVVAMNPDLIKPFKRYQIQPVWRADSPQLKRGRFREFYQCDMDIIGESSIAADAEIIAIMNNSMKELGFSKYVTKVNSRKVLYGMIGYSGVKKGGEAEVSRALDKLDKIGTEGVEKELANLDLKKKQIDILFDLILTEGNFEDKVEKIKPIAESNELFKKGLEEITDVFGILKSMKIPDETVEWNFALARGLDYYTGLIFETVLPDYPQFGSLAGGGRYDELIGLYLGRDVPATGASIGIDRIYSTIEQIFGFPERGTVTEVLVCVFSKDELGYSLTRASALREAGIKTEVSLGGGKLKKQFGYADKKKIPLVCIEGDNERNSGIVKIKHLGIGKEFEFNVLEAPRKIRELLAETK